MMDLIVNEISMKILRSDLYVLKLELGLVPQIYLPTWYVVFTNLMSYM